MKLERPQPRSDRIHALHVLRQETEPGFDLRDLMRSKAEEMRREVWDGKVGSDVPDYQDGILWRLANAAVLEQGLQVSFSDQAERETMNEIPKRVYFSFSEGDFHSSTIDLGKWSQWAGWVQCYPEKRSQVQLTDQSFDLLLNPLSAHIERLDSLRMALCLLQLRPDKREEIRQIMTPVFFELFFSSDAQARFSQQETLKTFTANAQWLADYLLIHPEDRHKFSLTDQVRQAIQRSLYLPQDPNFPTVGKLRDAAIIFAEDARVDEHGVIQVTYPPSQIKTVGSQLPTRLHM